MEKEVIEMEEKKVSFNKERLHFAGELQKPMFEAMDCFSLLHLAIDNDDFIRHLVEMKTKSEMFEVMAGIKDLFTKGYKGLRKIMDTINSNA